MRVGIDVGGTHIAVGIVDKEELTIKREFNHFKLQGKDELLKHISNDLDAVIEENMIPIQFIQSIGIGVPGKVNDKGEVFIPKFSTYEFNLRKAIEAKYDIPTSVINDAQAATLGELVLGNLRNSKNGIMITVGTGIGSGIVLNNRLYRGNSNTAGEVGHMKISMALLT